MLRILAAGNEIEMKTIVPRAMTIAGSDSGCGAGVQADLKTFAAMHVYGTSVLTAVTSQNTVGITDVMELPSSLIASQIDAILSDIGTDAVKIGMLSSSAIIDTVAEKIREYHLTALVVDPVMIAKGGDRLIQEDAISTLRDTLLPLAQVVTPNAPEAAVLTGHEVRTLDDARDAAREIVGMGASAVVVKGGHIEGPATDVLYDGKDFRLFTTKRIETTSLHGTGCTFASAITVGLAKGLTVREALSHAKSYVTTSIRQAFPMGHGHGPLNHFHMMWEDNH